MVQTKSRHHKTENTHRFLTLAERLANLNVDVVKRINRYDLKPEETETYFHQALVKWLDLNYSAIFNEFTAKIRHKCHSLAQLVYHQEALVTHLIDYINKADPLSLQPILDLTAQFARDLQVDFYQFFPRVFQSIVGLLDTQQTDVLEWSFQTLSYLFKFLWRYMLKDLENVYNLYSPLLNESRKAYIRNFSAESFAFLMRKVPDKNQLFDFLLNRLVKHPEEMDGIGRLIFEMFKGVKHQFNACTQQSLEVLLDKINSCGQDEDHNELVFNCIGRTLEAMASFTKKEHCSLIWRCFYNLIDKNLNDQPKLTYFMRLIHLFLQSKNCYLIDNLDVLLDNLAKLGKLDLETHTSLKFTQSFMDIGQILLLSENVKFQIDKATIVPNLIYQPKFDANLVFNLTRSLFSYDQFETTILPNVITYFDAHTSLPSNSDSKLIDLLTEYLVRHKKIINSELIEDLKSKNAVSGNLFDEFVRVKDLGKLVRFFADKKFTTLKLASNIEDFLTRHGNNYLAGKDQQPLILAEMFLLSPIVCPASERLRDLIDKLSVFLITRLNSSLTDKNWTSLEVDSFMLSLNLWSQMWRQNSNFEIPMKEIIGLIKQADEKKAPDSIANHFIRSLNYMITFSDDDGLRDTVNEVIEIIKSHLSSPYHEVRLNSINILARYFKPDTNKIEPIKLDGDEELDLFEIATKAEMTRASLENHRKKIFYLQRLDCNVCSKYLQIESIRDVPLRYFFGVLFENFKLIWDPVVTLVQNYANSMKMNEFWPVFFDYFTRLADKIESQSGPKREDTQEWELTLEQLKTSFTEETNPNIDYLNNRYLLCQAMKGFAPICESKTRFLVPIFFRFLNNEYYLEENRLLSTAYEDITKSFSERQSSQKTAKEKYLTKTLLNKHLCAYLDVFSLFTSPKSWHQEENLRNLYLNLLCHQEGSVQKAALKCLYTYQYPYLTPYKEHLERLLEGKHFRHELVIFSLDEQNGAVHIDDREKLLPILMRLLYGKFHSNETTHTASKDTKTNKRSTIIQFLSQCSENELDYFFNLIFECLNAAITRHASAGETGLVLAALNGDQQPLYELTQCIPFKKILGILQSLEIVMRKLARQMESFAHRIILMLGFVHKYALTLFDKVQALKKTDNGLVSVDDYHLNLLKIIRQQVTLRFKQFFETYDHLNLTQDEYFYIYNTFIWPQSIKIPHESLKSVSNMLKIYSLWSSRPRYYPLLVVRLSDFTSVDASLKTALKNSVISTFEGRNLLDILFELVDSAQCSPVVINHVIEMVHNLVSFADFVEETDDALEISTKPLPFGLDFVLDEFKDEKKDNLNFGTMILKPYVGSIVSHVERIVVGSMNKRSLPAKPLKILARLSGFASNSSQQCEKIIQLLIPYLIKNKKQDEETQLNILNSINHLIRKVSNVEDFICPLSRLFAVLSNRQSRVELGNIFESIREMDPQYEFISTVVNDLNSWDPKRLEEPDYMRRLDGFKHLNEAVKNWTQFDSKLASILIYNCFFFIKNMADLALKESSTNCVVEFLRKSSTMDLSKSERYLLEANFLAELKSGLKSKVENARHEFISILVVFIRLFGSMFPAYNDLSALFDDSDIEKDFYENIKHIQMHRRARALKRLQRACGEGLLSPETLTNFMMPIVRSFIDNEMYHKYDYLVEDACKALWAICSRLAWPKYVKILELYLKSLTKPKPQETSKSKDDHDPKPVNQKIIIKIICFILDAFHYDLSLSNKKDYFSDPGELMVEDDQNPKKTLVGSAMAFKIHSHLTQSLIPTLFKCLTKRLRSDGEHKANKREDESEQILRVPIALALLKLLINLPSRTFETHLPGLLFKVCDMLKSRAISVRSSTRECLIKMIDALPHKRYYSFVFKELSNALLRGYQVHVLCFTVYEVLKHIEPKLSCGDLDSSLDVLMSSVHLELFTDVSDEKEVKQIVAKTLEAKTVSSYGTLEILAKYVSKSNMLRIIKPFKGQLDTCNSKKLLKKIEDALRRVLLGLLANSSFSTDDLMELVHGLLNDTFDVLKDPGKFKKRKHADPDNSDDVKKLAVAKSCLIIPSEPKRGGDKPKVLTKTNQHVIVEFGLQLLHNLIKQNRLNNTPESSHKLDPYVSMFLEYLDGKYIKVTIITLRCLVGLLKFSLPTLERQSRELGTKLFALLRTFSASSTSAPTLSSTSSGDNFELLMVCYKLIASLIRDCSHFGLTDEQLQVLLHCAERNLYDVHKQASTFNLLKAIVSRRFECDELGDIVGRVMKLSIQAESPSVRMQSRQTVMTYLVTYAMAAGDKRFFKVIEFYLVQLNYEYEDGRESAIEMLATMFNTFQIQKLNEHAALFFLPLAVQLHNDESAKCKKLAWLALKSLLEKIDVEKRDSLFEITRSLFVDHEKPLHKRIGALLTKLFVEIEKQGFERRLGTCFEILASELDCKKYESEIETNSSGVINEKFFDQYLFNLLSLFMKILTECKPIESKRHLKTIFNIFDQVKSYLTHEHMWVRLISCQLFGHLFATQSIEDLVADKNGYFSFSTQNKYEKIRDLVDAFCTQMKSPVLETDQAEQIVKNLAFMAKIVNRNEAEFCSTEVTRLDHSLNLEWLIKKVTKEAKFELVNKPKETIKRVHVFKWIAAVVHELGKEKIHQYIHLLIGVLQREICIEQNDENLKRLAHEVLDFIKQVVGVEEFSVNLAKSSKRRVENREERKRKLAQTAVLDPQLAAMKKIRKMQRKKEAKKRKLEAGKNNKLANGGKKRKLIKTAKDNDDF